MKAKFKLFLVFFISILASSAFGQSYNVVNQTEYNYVIEINYTNGPNQQYAAPANSTVSFPNQGSGIYCLKSTVKPGWPTKWYVPEMNAEASAIVHNPGTTSTTTIVLPYSPNSNVQCTETSANGGQQIQLTIY